ncbi:MAG: class I SAM-dependent methyltransferase [Anaerolineae bacterium]|nr:class I SAM-dependent methyltransferase [Anaerolineae bacterium]
MAIDFGKTTQDYGKYRAGFPEAFFERLTAFGIGQTGQRVLDLGTGTGTVARGLARRGCRVVGLDPSGQLLAQGQQLDQSAGVAVYRLMARAERTGLANDSFEVITAGQCWHWFNRATAAQEIRRLLMPGGYLVIAHFDWLPLPGNVVEATEQLILQHNPAWRGSGGDGIHAAWLYDVAVAGFENIETFSFDTPAIYSHTAWRGRIRASAGVAASLPPEQVAQFDCELEHLLRQRFPDDPLVTPHRVFAVICRSPRS